MRTRDQSSSRARPLRPLSAEQPATLMVVPPPRSSSEPCFEDALDELPSEQQQEPAGSYFGFGLGYGLARCLSLLRGSGGGSTPSVPTTTNPSGPDPSGPSSSGPSFSGPSSSGPSPRAEMVRQSSAPQPTSSSARPTFWRQASEPTATSLAAAQASETAANTTAMVAPAAAVALGNGRRAGGDVIGGLRGTATPPVRRQVSDPVVPTSLPMTPLRRQASDPAPSPSPVSILRQPSAASRRPEQPTRVTITVPVETHAAPRPSLTRAFKEELRTSSL